MCLKDNNLNNDNLISEFKDIELSDNNSSTMENVVTSLKSSNVVGSQDISSISYTDPTVNNNYKMNI